jgi:hypothetical protein
MSSEELAALPDLDAGDFQVIGTLIQTFGFMDAAMGLGSIIVSGRGRQWVWHWPAASLTGGSRADSAAATATPSGITRNGPAYLAGALAHRRHACSQLSACLRGGPSPSSAALIAASRRRPRS